MILVTGANGTTGSQVVRLLARANQPVRALVRGPELLSYSEIVSRIGRAVGRPLQFIDMPEAAWRQNMREAGAPAELVDAAAHWYSAVRNGEMTIAPGVAAVLGHPGHTLDQWLADGGAALNR